MHRWAKQQLVPWKGHGVKKLVDIAGVVAERESAFAFSITDNKVHCDYKHTHLIFAQRAQMYHIFFNEIACRFNLPNTIFALDVGDEAKDSNNHPLFSFQRRKGFKVILLPDVDFLASNFYNDAQSWGLPDKVIYSRKSATACFVGSTTGAGLITRSLLDAGNVPRVEAARFFRSQPTVDFRLPNIVQCDPEAEGMLRAEGFGTNPCTWQDQLASKFLISIDGNGATCSRVFVSLASNSVLLKYVSDCEMFYFEGLEAGRHFIPIERHEDVLRAIGEEEVAPGEHAAIAKRSQEFAARHLSRGALEYYTADLLWTYAEAA